MWVYLVAAFAAGCFVGWCVAMRVLKELLSDKKIMNQLADAAGWGSKRSA